MSWRRKKDVFGEWEYFKKGLPKDTELSVFTMVDNDKDLGWFWSIKVEKGNGNLKQDDDEVVLNGISKGEGFKTLEEAQIDAVKGAKKFFKNVNKLMKEIEESLNGNS